MGDAADMALEQSLRVQYYYTEHPEEEEYAEKRSRIGSANYRRKSKKHNPKCKGKEVRRTNSKTGVEFIGCSEFPDCKWSRSLTSKEQTTDFSMDAIDPIRIGTDGRQKR